MNARELCALMSPFNETDIAVLLENGDILEINELKRITVSNNDQFGRIFLNGQTVLVAGKAVAKEAKFATSEQPKNEQPKSEQPKSLQPGKHHAAIILDKPSFDQAIAEAWMRFTNTKAVVFMGYSNPFDDVHIYNFEFEMGEKANEDVHLTGRSVEDIEWELKHLERSRDSHYGVIKQIDDKIVLRKAELLKLLQTGKQY